MAARTDLGPVLRAAVAQNISARHIDQLATGYLGFSSDEMDDIRHDKTSGLDIIREVLRRYKYCFRPGQYVLCILSYGCSKEIYV